MPVLVVAISAISAAAVLVRLVPDLSPPVVALWRCGLVAVLLAPALKRPGRRDLLLVAGAGLALAIHFWAWFASLHHTTVLRSTVLVCLSPVWTALLERLFLGHRSSSRYWLGVAVALGGIGLMAATAPAGREGSLLGDGLAVLGGIVAGVYLVTGRAVRQRVGIGAYGSMVSGFAALWLLPVALLLPGDPQLVGFPTETWLVLVAMAAGPQLLGHVGLNFAVKYLPAAVVSLVVLLEPVGAGVLAGFVLGEWPGPGEWAGAAVILAGVAVATVRWPLSAGRAAG